MSPSPKRILFVETNEDGTTGGSHRSMYELVRRLDRNRFEPLALYYQDNVFADKLRDEGIAIVPFAETRARELTRRRSGSLLAKLSDIAGAIPRRMEIIGRVDAALVHINNSPAVAYDDWLPAARLSRVPIVSSVRGDAVAAGALGRALFRRFDRVMAVSAWIGDVMRREGVPEANVRVVYNGVDVAGIQARVRGAPCDVRRELGLPDGRLLGVMVGNLRAWKGQRPVLEALAMARRGGADFHVALVGEPATLEEDRRYEEDLHEFVRQASLGPFVSFMGKRADVPELFAGADVAIHASIDPEPFGLVLVEALAAGTPVLASSYGGPAEVLTEDTGFLHDPRDPAQLAAIFARIAAEPTILPAMRQAAGRRAWEFDIGKTVARMEAIYDEVLGRT